MLASPVGRRMDAVGMDVLGDLADELSSELSSTGARVTAKWFTSSKWFTSPLKEHAPLEHPPFNDGWRADG
jgi:hypothetical protein